MKIEKINPVSPISKNLPRFPGAIPDPDELDSAGKTFREVLDSVNFEIDEKKEKGKK